MKKFSRSFNGYNKEEVNAFVARVTKEYENMLQSLKDRDAKLKGIEEKLLQYKNMENTLNRALMVAEDASNQIKKMARDESKSIVDDARKNASRIVNDALIKAQALENDAEELRRKIIMFKRRFRIAVENELEAIEQIGEDM